MSSIRVYGDDGAGGFEASPSGTAGNPLVVTGALAPGMPAEIRYTSTSGVDPVPAEVIPVAILSGSRVFVHEVVLTFLRPSGAPMLIDNLDDTPPVDCNVSVGAVSYAISDLMRFGGLQFVDSGGSKAALLSVRVPVNMLIASYNSAVVGSRVALNVFDNFSGSVGVAVAYSVVPV